MYKEYLINDLLERQFSEYVIHFSEKFIEDIIEDKSCEQYKYLRNTFIFSSAHCRAVKTSEQVKSIGE